MVRCKHGMRWLSWAAVLWCLLLSPWASNGQSGSDYRQNVLNGGRLNGFAIQKANQSAFGRPPHIFCPKGNSPYLITNSLTLINNSTFEAEQGATFQIFTNQVFDLGNCNVMLSDDVRFIGAGTVTGRVSGLWGCFPTNWNGMTTGTYALECVDPAGNLPLGGDLYGTIDNAQIRTNAVTTVEILNATILPEDLSWSISNAFSRVNTNGAGAFLAITFPGDATQVVTNHSIIRVAITNETFDYAGGYNPATSKFTFPWSGIWALYGACSLEPSHTNFYWFVPHFEHVTAISTTKIWQGEIVFRAPIDTNGFDIADLDIIPAYSAFPTRSSFFSAGDTVQMGISNIYGNKLISQGNSKTFFGGHYIGAAQ